MKPKERMLTAIGGGKPDRLPVTIHQWQGYHLRNYMNGMTQLEAFQATGLDASITPRGILRLRSSPGWVIRRDAAGGSGGEQRTRICIETPDGELTASEARGDGTVYMTEHLLKDAADAERFLKHWPGMELDKAALSACYDETGDTGIVRGNVEAAHQPGAWQDFCELVGTEKAILWALDEPESVHDFLERLTQKRVVFVHEQMAGARFDLVEHGGGAASSNVISPSMFDEFCVPYDRRVIDALHEVGLKVVYHTCGAMMAILDRIPANGCDASETLSPPGVGGDIATREDRLKVKATLGSQVALIGGIDQGRLEKPCAAEAVRDEVVACFEAFGAGGGYICSASDHFFHAPPENLKALADAARECVYA
jgi:hypothetical protein